MDDKDDDARYSPDPYPPRDQTPVDDSFDEEEKNFDDDVDEENDDDAETSSHRRGGKRRKLDELALAFEFAPRPSLPPPPPSAVALPRSSPTEWSEHSTIALLDAWGDRFLRNGRKSLRPNEWIDVSRHVSHALRIPLSNSQCQNRLGTLKKKYKKEKASESLGSKSNWVYFNKLDALISSSSSPPPPLPPPKQDFSEEESEEEEEESEGLPPVGRGIKGSNGTTGGLGVGLIGMLAESVVKFGEIYERIGSCKRRQMAELERMRKEFQRDLEVHKRKILERAKAEIENMRVGGGGDEEEEDAESLSGECPPALGQEIRRD